MQRSVTLGGRRRVAALLEHLEQKVGQRGDSPRLDRRNRRTGRQMVWAVLVGRSTRLLALARVVAPQRRANSVKATAQGLSYFLAEAQAPVASLSAALLEEAVRTIDPERLVCDKGQALVALDPTEYEKRSRGTGKCGRQMEHIGRVRRSKTTKSARGKSKSKGRGKGARTTTTGERAGSAARPRSEGRPAPADAAETPPKGGATATTYGYVDIWAGLVLKGKQFLPLARELFSSRQPGCTSQNTVEEAVLARALALLRRVGLAAIVLGDRGVGRKELLIRLANEDQSYVLRVDPDITVYPADRPDADGLLLADALEQQPWRGEVEWDRGQQGRLRCRLRTLRAAIRFSRSGRKDDVQEATVTFVEAVPLDGRTDPLVLATTLPVNTVAEARAIVRLYAQRWAIETGFETMHAWGQERFMVRRWTDIDRLLWILAVAYALTVLALSDPTLRRFRDQATALLKQLSVVGDRLTPGKLAEAISLDYQQHQRAWISAWLT